MAFESDMLRQFTFFTRASDEEVMLYKLSKIGVKRTDLAINPMPPSALRKDYVVNVDNRNFIYCVNCDHVKISHQESTIPIEGIISDICYGLSDEGENCKCKKFIDVDGKTLNSSD